MPAHRRARGAGGLLLHGAHTDDVGQLPLPVVVVTREEAGLVAAREVERHVLAAKRQARFRPTPTCIARTTPNLHS